jgi:short-subunit dehydrogenase
MGEVALITGASSGLGLSYARLFAADHRDLVLVARRRDRLESLAREISAAHGVKVQVIDADLAIPSTPRRIAEEVKRLGLEIEYLVNNAGFGTTGPFAESDPAKELEMVQVNIAAVVELTRAFLPPMIQYWLDSWLSAGTFHGRLLCEQGLRELIYRGALVRGEGHRGDGNGQLSRRHRHRVRRCGR